MYRPPTASYANCRGTVLGSSGLLVFKNSLWPFVPSACNVLPCILTFFFFLEFNLWLRIQFIIISGCLQRGCTGNYLGWLGCFVWSGGSRYMKPGSLHFSRLENCAAQRVSFSVCEQQQRMSFLKAHNPYGHNSVFKPFLLYPLVDTHTSTHWSPRMKVGGNGPH